MVNVTSIAQTIGGTGLKAINLIPNSSVTEEATTITVSTPIAQYIMLAIIIFIIYKILIRR